MLVLLITSCLGSGWQKPTSVCGMGHFISNDAFGSQVCIGCPAGRYNLAVNRIGSSALACHFCPQGKFQHAVGQSFCYTTEGTCPPGTYNARARALGPGRLVWVPLQLPLKAGPRARAGCVACPAGKFQHRIRDTRDTAQQRMFQVCSSCRPGYFSNAGLSRCNLCSKGFFQPMRGQPTCVSCSPGQFAARHGSTKCSLCHPGRAAAKRSSPRCDGCSRGRHIDAHGAQQCSRCWGDNVQVGTGMRFCTQCPEGKYASENKTSCELVMVATLAPNPRPTAAPTPLPTPVPSTRRPQTAHPHRAARPRAAAHVPAAHVPARKPHNPHTASVPHRSNSVTLAATAKARATGAAAAPAPSTISLQGVACFLAAIVLGWGAAMVMWALNQRETLRAQQEVAMHSYGLPEANTDETAQIVNELLTGGAEAIRVTEQARQKAAGQAAAFSYGAYGATCPAIT